jgi:hypothetical protein
MDSRPCLKVSISQPGVVLVRFKPLHGLALWDATHKVGEAEKGLNRCGTSAGDVPKHFPCNGGTGHEKGTIFGHFLGTNWHSFVVGEFRGWGSAPLGAAFKSRSSNGIDVLLGVDRSVTAWNVALANRVMPCWSVAHDRVQLSVFTQLVAVGGNGRSAQSDLAVEHTTQSKGED